ncbi:MAG: putative porin, partial [Caulobacteraceae bacterium]|nr:putative porin [Caulobacteraceae bacterium]
MAVNLIHLLVKQGVITQAAADALMQEAEAETKQAQAQAQTQAQASASAMAALPPAADGVVRVPYVPEVVRNQIRDDIKKEVLAEAKTEGWAAPNAVPSWVDRVHFFGDLRFRLQDNFYPSGNLSPYIDYATLNATGPIDIRGDTNPGGLPFLDTTTQRINQLSLRARLGVKFDIADGVGLTVRLASGSDNSPVSTTQALGGGLAKKDIWLDQAFVTLNPVDWVELDLGRTPNLFMHTDLLFDDNLNLDGALGTASWTFADPRLSVFGAGGAFPLDYVAQNTPTDGQSKTGDSTKWLFAAQVGAKFQQDYNGWSLQGAVSYYDFDNVAGQLSA